MRSFRLFIIITSLILPPCVFGAQNPNDVSVNQLKAEIQKLIAIERDETVSPAVRELNHSFLQKRRAELQVLLQKNLAALRSYLETVGASLRIDEKAIVQNAIAEAERDMKGLGEEPPTSTRESADSSTRLMIPSPALLSDSSSEQSEPSNRNSNVGPASVINAHPVTRDPAAPSNIEVPAASQPQPSTSLNAAVNARIRAKVRVDQTDNTKQTDTPSISGNSSSLVDQSSASDLIGIGANFAGLSATSNNQKDEPSSVSVTASAYSLLAAIKRVDPLNPVFYDQNRKWRNFSITLGYDDEDQPDGTRQRAKIFGGKFMFINRRDPSLSRNKLYIDTITNSLATATGAFGDLSVRIRGYVFNLESVRRNFIAPGFKNFLEKKKPQIQLALETGRSQLATATPSSRPTIEAQIARMEESLRRIDEMLTNPGDPSLFVLGTNSLPTPNWTREEREYFVEFQNEYLGSNYRQKLGEEIAAAVDEFIERQLTDAELRVFRNLDDVSRDAVERIRRAPQLSLAFATKQRRVGIDEYLGTLIFDYGVANRINLSLNAAYTYNDSKLIGGDLRGFRFGGQLRFQLNRENLLGKKPLFFDVSTQGNWMNNVDAIYKAQGKLTIPIADGIEFPVSVTYANRSDLINEREVRGQFGFTLDTARLVRAFLFR